MSKLRVRLRKYKIHRKGAKKRGISWHFTYVSWSRIWMRSGHWYERGCHKGQYQMARFNDIGPYAPWNVKIITVEENSREANLGRKLSLDRRNEITRIMTGNQRFLGHRHSDETRVEISKRMMGNKNGKGGKLGNKNGRGCRSQETRARMAIAQKIRRERERLCFD